MAASEELNVWMDPVEWSQIRAALTAVGPRRYLEWGSGGSTRAILDACPELTAVVSVEHNRAWYEQVKGRINDQRLTLTHVPADVPMPAPNKQAQTDWDNRAEVDATLYASYIRYPATLGMAFDVVLVDGRARCFCMPEGFRLLRPGGILILHDAQRTEYHTAAAALGKPVFLTPWKQGQVCLVRKDDAR